MTPEERIQLNRFLQLLEQAQAGVKDPEAETLIREAVGRKPDAAYLLVQRVLQLEHALKEARNQNVDQSFTGNANAWGRGQPAVTPAVTPALTPSAPQPAPAQSRWGSGLLGTVASTAAGVVAGSMLAQGIGSLFGQHAQAAPTGDSTTIPPGGGTLVETDYGARANNSSEDYLPEDFDPGDTGDSV
jgi:uncharacterized protein